MVLRTIKKEEEKKDVTNMPHRETFDRWRSNLSDADHQRVIEAIHNIMDNTPHGEHIITSSYIPGRDWRGTPFDPIYQACNQNWEAARLFFGQLVWEAVQEHDDIWYFIRQERDDDQPIGLTYFRRSA